jgi:hypothetical protein
MAIAGYVRAFIRANQNVPNPMDLRSGVVSDYVNRIFQFTDGVGAGQNDLVWSDEQSVAGGAGFGIDLTGALLDVWGDPVVFQTLTGIVFYNQSTTAQTFTIGPNTGADPFLGPWVAANDRNVVEAGNCLLMYSDEGWPIVTNASDKFVVSNLDAAANTFSMVLVGRSV